MQEKTDLFGRSIPEGLRHLAKEHRQVLLLLGGAASGYVMASSLLFGSVAPFGAAFCAALPWKYVSGAAAGAILGHILGLGQTESVKYIAAILFMVILKWLGSRRRVRIAPSAEAIGCALAGMGLATVAVLLAADPTLYDALLAVAELLLATGAAYFFARALFCLELGFGGISRSDTTCIVISFAVVVMGFAPVAPGGFSVGRMLCVLVVLLCARYGGEGAGAVSGVVSGIAMGFAGGDFGYTVSSYAFGGLMSGVFGPVGRLAAASAFVVVNALCAIFVGDAGSAYTSIGEIFIASAVFVALPQSLIGRLRIPELRPAGEDGAALQQTLRGRMEDISHALREIGVTTREVSRHLGRRTSPPPTAVSAQVAGQICRRCGSRTACWQDHRAETEGALEECVRILRRDGTVTREQLPRYFARSCCKPDRLLGELNAQFQRGVAREGVTRRVTRVRSVVADQFEGVAMVIDELAGELCGLRLLEPSRTARVKEYLEQEGVEVRRLVCWQDELGHTHLEAALPAYQMARLGKVKLTLDLSAILECDFDAPVFAARGKEGTVTLSEKAAFTLETGAYQLSADGGGVCGDAYELLRGPRGVTHLILSDGMGSGGPAAVDSTMSSGLIARLLAVGVGHDAALRMVNSALLVKSGEESLATIDICSIDLYSGCADLYKAGAAPTYLLRDGRAGCIESTSLPAGILRGVAFEKSTLTLREGDMVVMVSDGVTATGEGWIPSELRSMAGEEDLRRLCEQMAETAHRRRTDGRDDDITVLAARLRRGI